VSSLDDNVDMNLCFIWYVDISIEP